MVDILGNLYEERYRYNMAVAADIESKLGVKPPSPLKKYFAHTAYTPDLNALRLPHYNFLDQGADPDLEKLGLSADSPKIKLVQIELATVHQDIQVIRKSVEGVFDIRGHIPSAKELNLFFKKDIPDASLRKELIQLLFVEGVHNHSLVSLIDALAAMQFKDLDDDPTSIDDHTESDSDNSDTVIQFPGEESVEAEKRARGIVTDDDAVEECVVEQIFEPNYSAADYQTLQEQTDILLEYVKSTFCFCVSTLAEIPENIMHMTHPELFPNLTIPPSIQQKLDLVQSITDRYWFFTDYVSHLEVAVQAYIKVFNGIVVEHAEKTA